MSNNLRNRISGYNFAAFTSPLPNPLDAGGIIWDEILAHTPREGPEFLDQPKAALPYYEGPSEMDPLENGWETFQSDTSLQVGDEGLNLSDSFQGEDFEIPQEELSLLDEEISRLERKNLRIIIKTQRLIIALILLGAGLSHLPTIRQYVERVWEVLGR